MGVFAWILVAALPSTRFSPELELSTGRAVVVEAPVRLPRGLPRATANVELIRRTDAADVYRDAQVVVRGAKSRLRWLVAAGGTPARGVLRFDVVIRGPRRVIRRVRVRQEVITTSAPLDDAPIEAAFTTLARPEGKAPEGAALEERPDAKRWVAAHRLRAAARRPDDVGRRAWATVAEWTRADGTRDTPSDAEGPLDAELEDDVAQVLSGVLRDLKRFDADRAGARLEAVRLRSNLNPGELARILELQACLQSTTGSEPNARRLWAQALSLVPDLEPNCPISWGRAHFADLRERLAPERPLGVGRILVKPVEGGEGLEVTVDVGPDAARLARRIDVEIQPHPDGDVHRRAVALQHAGDRGRGQFVLPQTAKPSPQVPVRVRVLDRAGIELAGVGRPDPLFVPMPREQKSFRVPPWVWWVAGGVAVAGGTTAVVFLATRDTPAAEPERRLGPIDIRF